MSHATAALPYLGIVPVPTRTCVKRERMYEWNFILFFKQIGVGMLWFL